MTLAPAHGTREKSKRTGKARIGPHGMPTRHRCLLAYISMAMRPAPKKKAVAKLRSWRVSIIRKRGQYLGTVEAPTEKAAEAAAVAEFESQRRAAEAVSRQALTERTSQMPNGPGS
jgi:hypothetical protein